MSVGFQGESMSGLGLCKGRFYVQDELGSGTSTVPQPIVVHIVAGSLTNAPSNCA